MAVDKLVDSTQLDSDLTSVANAIRIRGGTSSQMAFPSGFVSSVEAIGNSYSQSDEGKVVSNGALVAQTAHADVTPTTSDQTIDTTTNNSIKVKGDADLLATNIKKDVEIFGVTGSYEGGGGALKVAEGTFIGDGTTYYDVELSGVDFSPDIVLITRADLRNMSAVNMRALAYFTGWKGWYFSGGQSSSGTTNISARNSIALAEGSFDGGGGRITYSESTQKLQIHCAIFGMGVYYAPVTYNYILIKYTE